MKPGARELAGKGIIVYRSKASSTTYLTPSSLTPPHWLVSNSHPSFPGTKRDGDSSADLFYSVCFLQDVQVPSITALTDVP